MTTLDILIAAKALIDTPEKWTKGDYARDARGFIVDPMSEQAGCWCMIGALIRVEPYVDDRRPARWALAHAIQDALADWNDAPERTHAEVMDAFDRAIEAERATSAKAGA